MHGFILYVLQGLQLWEAWELVGAADHSLSHIRACISFLSKPNLYILCPGELRYPIIRPFQTTDPLYGPTKQYIRSPLLKTKKKNMQKSPKI